MNITRYISKAVLASSAFCSIAAVSIGTLTSCDDFLDVKSETVAKENELFETKEGFQDALTGCYELMSSQNAYGKNMSFYMVDALANYWDMNLPMGGSENADISEITLFDYESDDSRQLIENTYLQMYKTILQANIILKNLQTNGHVIGNSQLRNMIEAECYAIRAYCHFDILRVFGQVPQNATKTVSLAYNESTSIDEMPPFYKYDEFVAKLKADLDKAEKIMKEYDPVYNHTFYETFPNTTNSVSLSEEYLYYRRMRLNYWAVRATQARLALYTGDKATAHSLAVEIINAKSDNGESIVQLSDLKPSLENGKTVIYPSLPSENIFSLSVFNLLTYTNTYFPLEKIQRSSLVISDAQYNKLYEGQVTASHNRYSYWWRRCTTNQSAVGRVLTKYYWNTNSDTGLAPNAYNNLFIPMIRLSEIYLMAIETTTDLAEANSLYNTYMRYHNVLLDADAFASLNDVKNVIIDEYRRELIGEGQMFYVYKRLCSPSILWHSTNVSEADYVVKLPLTK